MRWVAPRTRAAPLPWSAETEKRVRSACGPQRSRRLGLEHQPLLYFAAANWRSMPGTCAPSSAGRLSFLRTSLRSEGDFGLQHVLLGRRGDCLSEDAGRFSSASGHACGGGPIGSQIRQAIIPARLSQRVARTEQVDSPRVLHEIVRGFQVLDGSVSSEDRKMLRRNCVRAGFRLCGCTDA